MDKNTHIDMDGSYKDINREQGQDPRYSYNRDHWQWGKWRGDLDRNGLPRCHHANEYDASGKHYEQAMFEQHCRESGLKDSGIDVGWRRAPTASFSTDGSDIPSLKEHMEITRGKTRLVDTWTVKSEVAKRSRNGKQG